MAIIWTLQLEIAQPWLMSTAIAWSKAARSATEGAHQVDEPPQEDAGQQPLVH